MSRRHARIALCLVLSLATVGAVAYGLATRPPALGSPVPVDRRPGIRPDYADLVIPPNIAPLSFVVEEEAGRYCVEVAGPKGEAIRVHSRKPSVVIPEAPWRRLLEANAGGEVSFIVHTLGADGRWSRFEPITNSVSRDAIDGYVVFRELNVIYNNYRNMRLSQRELEGYDEVTIVDNRSFDRGCVNCHTFYRNGTDKMLIHMRSGQVNYGNGMLLFEDGKVSKVSTATEFTPRPAAFTSWHPQGDRLAFSMNKVRQAYHSSRSEVRDGYDLDSDLAVYLLDGGQVVSTPAICRPKMLETWPTWSADGKYLYFCNAPIPWGDEPTFPPEGYQGVRYDLVRIPYDARTGRWGELEAVISAEECGMSVTLPRFSPDGRYLVVCMSDYSTFPTFQPSSDLYLVDAETGGYERMACNSNRSESWHSWSSNGRWLAFGSKRDDGQFERIYLAHVDEGGRSGKAFVMPQRDPTFYDGSMKVYQLPELVTAPVPVTGERLARVIRSRDVVEGQLPVTGATPAGQWPSDRPRGQASPAGSPWRPAGR